MNPRHMFFSVLAGGLLLDLLSISAWANPRLAMPIMITVLAGVAYVVSRDITWGAIIVLVELIWGSHGRLLVASVDGAMVSLRMGIFAVVLAATFWDLRKRSSRDALRMAFSIHPARAPLALLVATFVIGLLLGFIRHPIGLVFQDANAWLFFALLPTFLIARTRMTPQETLRVPTGQVRMDRADDTDTRIIFGSIVLASAAYFILRFFVLLFVFSHETGDTMPALYRWVRDTRLGEVTFFANGFPRVFIPSIALLFPIMGLIATRRVLLSHVALVGAAGAVIVASFSRSFWFGGAVALAALVAVHLVRKQKALIVLRAFALNIFAIIVGVAVVAILVRFPYPPSTMRAGFSQAVVDRFAIAGEAAASNREQEIVPLRNAIAQHPVFGNGFGATVTYETKDPRTLAEHPDGRYTTYAFEWGYLDHALETGFLGIIALLWFLGVVLAYGWRRGGSSAAIAWGVLAIAVTHVTSPYLNHPIGIGAILWLTALVGNGSSLNRAKNENIG